MKNTIHTSLIIATAYFVLFTMLLLLLLGGHTGIFGVFALLGGIPGSLAALLSFLILQSISKWLFNEQPRALSVARSISAMLAIVLAFAASIATILAGCSMEGLRF